VQQERRLTCLGQRRLEGRNQLVGQLADEPDRIGDDDRAAAGQHHAPHQRVERREQLVRDVGIGAGQRAEQRRLPGVGVADQGDRGDGDLDAPLAPGLALLLELLEASRQHAHALAEQPAVGLELGLTRAAQADAALLALEVGPAPHQAAGDVPQLRELDLELAFVAAGALREDVEDQGVAVEHAAADELLEVAFLARRERMVDEHHVAAGVGDDLADLLGLAAADEEPGFGAVATPRHGGDRLHAGGLRELRELVEVFLLDRAAQAHANQNRSLAAAGSLEHPPLPRGRRLRHQSAAASVAPAASSAEGTRTLRAGTTVEIACL
jgi:hypothetical protein